MQAESQGIGYGSSSGVRSAMTCGRHSHRHGPGGEPLGQSELPVGLSGHIRMECIRDIDFHAPVCHDLTLSFRAAHVGARSAGNPAILTTE